MKLAYVTQYDAQNVKYWSGTGYNIAQSLAGAGLDIDYVGPLKNARDPINIAQYLIQSKLLGKTDQPQRDPGFLRHYARQAETMLANSDAQVIVAPGGLPLTYLKTDLPIVLWTDCTFANLLGYYPSFSNLSRRSLANGHDCERRALANCDLMLFSSQWAADSAIADYGADPDRIRIVPLGSNLPEERDAAQVEAMIADRIARLSGKVTLFAMGVDWLRKGMDIAVEVTKGLSARGLDVELLIAGCSPPAGTILPDNVRLLGFISKNDPGGLARVADLYAHSHFFILPTRADCFGIVFAEASQFGVPSIAPDTGGVATAVLDGVNGLVMQPDAPVDRWVDGIAALIGDRDRYGALCRSSYDRYRKELNWTALGKTVAGHVEELVKRGRTAGR